jgi:hypothetical protein
MEKRAKYDVIQLVRNIEEVGTSRTAFRFMYGAFLKEALHLLRNDDLIAPGHDMGNTANTWRELSHLGVKIFRSSLFNRRIFFPFRKYLPIELIVKSICSENRTIFTGDFFGHSVADIVYFCTW